MLTSIYQIAEMCQIKLRNSEQSREERNSLKSLNLHMGVMLLKSKVKKFELINAWRVLLRQLGKVQQQCRSWAISLLPN